MDLEQMNDTTLVLERFYEASAKRLFKAWTDPEDLRKWYSPVAGWTVSKAEVDLRPGGGYRLEFGPPDGPLVVELGTYVEVLDPELLIVDIRIEGRSIDEVTRLKVEFITSGTGTQVRLTEGDYSSKQRRDMHAQGWAHCLSLLEGVLRT